MTTLFIALKLLWRRKAANFVLLLQVLVSVAMLAQMYVFLVDHLDNVRAVGELPTENALVLPVFEYYPPAYAAERLEASPLVEEVAAVDTGGGTCGDTGCNVAIYGDGIVRHYTPALQSGGWLEGEAEMEDGVLPAVVSQEVGLRVGDTGTVRLTTGDTARKRDVGCCHQSGAGRSAARAGRGAKRSVSGRVLFVLFPIVSEPVCLPAPGNHGRAV